MVAQQAEQCLAWMVHTIPHMVDMAHRILLMLMLCAAAACGPADEPPVAPDGVYQIGINEQDAPPPSTFELISDGAEVPVVLGSQGAWMVVGAVRTTAFEGTDKVSIIAELEDAETGERYARVKFRRPLEDGADGYRYITDIFLIVGQAGGKNEYEWEGRDVVLNLRVEEYWGAGLEASAAVRLRTRYQ